jgi:hypothetical protein
VLATAAMGCNIHVGARKQSNGTLDQPFKGIQQQVALFYDQELTVAQLRTIAAGGTALASLAKFYYQMTGASPEPDASPNGNNATVIGTPTVVSSLITVPTVGLPNAFITSATPQAIPTGGGGTPISWTTPIKNEYGLWVLSDPTALIVQAPGVYCFTGSIRYDGNTGGTYRYAFLYKNGSVNLGAAGIPTSAQTLAQALPPIASPPVHCVAGDYVQLMALHDMGSDRNFVQGVFGGFAVALL